MSKIICKALQLVVTRYSPSPRALLAQNLNFIQLHPFSSSLNSIPISPNGHSFVAAYLVNSCGVPLEKALSLSENVKFEAPDRPDSVLAFFESHEFTRNQISRVISECPRLLLCNPEKTLLPKLEFLKSKGFSTTDIPKILSGKPRVLSISLENQLIPSFNFLKNCLQSQERTIAAIKRCSGLLVYMGSSQNVASNIEILREAGVPDHIIMPLLLRQPRAFTVSGNKFREIVEEVQKMGFNPARTNFVLAVRVLTAMKKSTWEKKIEVYKKWGWSEDVILEAFGKDPACMMASEDKIMAVLGFFVNKMGLGPMGTSLVAKRPRLIKLSLEKRFIPRSAVYQVLLSKGLIKTKSLSDLMDSSENMFLKRFVNCHEEEAPELVKLYQEKLALANQLRYST